MELPYGLILDGQNSNVVLERIGHPVVLAANVGNALMLVPVLLLHMRSVCCPREIGQDELGTDTWLWQCFIEAIVEVKVM